MVVGRRAGQKGRAFADKEGGLGMRDKERALLSQAIHVERLRRRKHTASTQTRGEVSGGGRKPWRQKGTGRARQGSIRAPHFKGGGVIFGPKPIQRRVFLPKKMQKKAWRLAWEMKNKKGQIVVVDFPAGLTKTRELVSILGREALLTPALLVYDKEDWLRRAGRNLLNLKVCSSEQFSLGDLLFTRRIFLSASAQQFINAKYAT